MITYYLTLSQVFPSTHSRAGEPTNFECAFKAGQVFNRGSECLYRNPKLHTIRANYDFWAKRFEKIAAGEAGLSIRQWVGKPYGKGSTQREIARLTREDGIGLQQLRFTVDMDCQRVALINGITLPSLRVLANNDGLSLEDWNDWFSGYDCSKPMAIIHFTNYRY